MCSVGSDDVLTVKSKPIALLFGFVVCDRCESMYSLNLIDKQRWWIDKKLYIFHFLVFLKLSKFVSSKRVKVHSGVKHTGLYALRVSSLRCFVYCIVYDSSGVCKKTLLRSHSESEVGLFSKNFIVQFLWSQNIPLNNVLQHGPNLRWITVFAIQVKLCKERVRVDRFLHQL